jgi:hypothetical protein
MITLTRVCFSDKATFHTSGKVNRHNVRIWGSENPRVILEMERDSPKVNVWWVLMHNKVTGPFFFSESTNSAIVYLDMMELYAAPEKSFSHEYFSNRIVHRHTGGYVLVSSWMQRFQTDRLGATVQHHGHHVHRTLPLWTFFYGSMLRTKCIRHQFLTLTI